MTIHEELDKKIAEFKKEAALTFQSGYMANLGLFKQLLNAET